MGDRSDGGRGDRIAAGAELILPLLALAFALYFFWSIRGLVWEAKANGVVVGTTLVVLCVLQLVRTVAALRARQAALDFGPLLWPWPVQLRRLAIVALTAGFVATVDRLGTLGGLFLLTAGSMAVLGVRKCRWLIGLPLAICAFVYIMFVIFLRAPIPEGPVEAVLSTTVGLP